MPDVDAQLGRADLDLDPIDLFHHLQARRELQIVRGAARSVRCMHHLRAFGKAQPPDLRAVARHGGSPHLTNVLVHRIEQQEVRFEGSGGRVRDQHKQTWRPFDAVGLTRPAEMTAPSLLSDRAGAETG